MLGDLFGDGTVLYLNCYGDYSELHLIKGFPQWLSSKNPPAMQELQEMWVRLLSWKDPLEEGMAMHSSILA